MFPKTPRGFDDEILCKPLRLTLTCATILTHIIARIMSEKTTQREYQKRKKLERKSTHKRVEIQLTLAEYRAFVRIAKNEDMSTNSLIKKMAIAYRDKVYFVPNELQASVNKLSLLIRNIANNLNQMAHSANVFKRVDENRVFQHLVSLDEQVQAFVKNELQ